MNSFLKQYNGPLKPLHISQEDDGWQKNIALNKAILKSKTDYLIFIDGDCVLHPRFVEEHLKHADEKTILAGRRVKLGPKASAGLRKHLNPSFLANNYPRYLLSFFADNGSFLDEGIYNKRLAQKRKSKTLKGCNFSCYKSALIAINGFDEQFKLPAVGEDTDLGWRFEGLGFVIKSVRHLAIQYHLFHKNTWSDTTVNVAYMNRKKIKKEFVAIDGLV